MEGPGELRVGCCIAGGGPAGMMLGFLLARAGIEVAVLEKHADFFRDFRGDTIHPSTLEVVAELGLLDAFLALPHQEVPELAGKIGDETIPIADFRHLPTRCKFLALMPQWDFLNFLAEHGQQYPGFRLLMEATAHELVWEGDRVAGLRAMTPRGPLSVRADLVVAADGRHSMLREAAKLTVRDFGAPMDVLWMRIPRLPGDDGQTLGIVAAGSIFVLLDRTAYYQAGLIIAKGGYDAIRAQGIEAFRARLEALAPFLRGRLDVLRSFDDVSLLTVKVDRLEQWYRPGLLCIGDAAHAMSPIGGVGINLAIQDAVASANRLAEPLRAGGVGLDDLRAVQRRRELPTRITQALQVAIQNRIIRRVLNSTQRVRAPWVVRLLRTIPYLRRIPARVVGIGFRPEHVRSPRA